MTCEECGGTMVEDDGVFECEDCEAVVVALDEAEEAFMDEFYG